MSSHMRSSAGWRVIDIGETMEMSRLLLFIIACVVDYANVSESLLPPPGGGRGEEQAIVVRVDEMVLFGAFPATRNYLKEKI